MSTNFNPLQILGMAVLVLAAILLVLAWHASNAPIDQLSHALTGRFTDHTMWYVVLGAASAVSGGALLLAGKRAS
jgi:hypothetical protein